MPSRFEYGVRVYPYAISISVKNTASDNLRGKLYGKEADSFSVGRESLLALPDEELTLTRMAYFSEHDLALISAHRKPASRFGFAVLLCYLKNVGFTPDKKSLPLMRC